MDARDIEMMEDAELAAEAARLRAAIASAEERLRAVEAEVRVRAPEESHGLFCPCGRCSAP